MEEENEKGRRGSQVRRRLSWKMRNKTWSVCPRPNADTTENTDGTLGQQTKWKTQSGKGVGDGEKLGCF